MLRRLIQILTAISFIAFLAITAFWVRSYWKSEHIAFTLKNERWELNSADGKFSIDNEPEIAAQQAVLQLEAGKLSSLANAKIQEGRVSKHSQPKLIGEISDLLSELNTIANAKSGLHARSMTLPPPLFVIVSLILPVLAYRRRLIPRIRTQAGLCGACGYDLRATPNRCPDCGAGARQQ